VKSLRTAGREHSDRGVATLDAPNVRDANRLEGSGPLRESRRFKEIKKVVANAVDRDKTEESIVFFRSALDRLRTHGPLPLGLHLLMGDDAVGKFANLLRNPEEDRARVVQAVGEDPCGRILAGDPRPILCRERDNERIGPNELLEPSARAS